MRSDSLLKMESYGWCYLLDIYLVFRVVTLHKNLFYVLRNMLLNR
jgi:hypothetical protein